MTAQTTRNRDRLWSVRSNRILHWLSRRWLLVFTLFLAIFNGLPWLAPLFLEAGWTRSANAIYLLYSALCHQLPQRSFFLFGEQLMVPLDTIQAAGQDSVNPLILRQFNGTDAIGWKVAWSDRMVYMYGSLFLFGIVFWPLRKRLPHLSWKGLFLFLLPMAVDGVTHMLGDLTGGIGGGFRYTNEWLAILTGSVFPTTFYAGDGLGSFNSWLRLITGLLFGLGVVWFAYPHLHKGFADTAHQIEAKFQQANRKL